MKNIHTYLAIPWLILLACLPPVKILISLPQTDCWFILILVAGFFGLFTIFIKTDWKIKVVAISSFILCFYASSFAISFSSYVSVILCCYFYINCLKIEDWNLIFKVLQTLLFLNILLIGMQFLGQDSLLNWSLANNITCFGAIGYHMQMGSFAVVICAVLASFCVWNLIPPFFIAFFCTSTWTLFCAGLGVFMVLWFKNKKIASVFALITLLIFSIWSIKESKFVSNMAENGRIGTWEKSLHYALQKPMTGWGPGSYKVIFPPLDRDILGDKPYSTAHNWIIELMFEMGIPFTLFILGWLSHLFYRLWKAKEIMCVVGMAMIGVDGLVHFPDRMAQCVPIIICFLAYCRVKLNRSL